MEQCNNKKYAFLFEGVGSEYQKFVYLFDSEQKKVLHRYCSIVEKELDLDLWNYLIDSSKTKLSKMFSDWIAIYTCDCIVFNEYSNFGIKPNFLLGYSMGLITAMVCGKSISFETGLHMLLSIYEYPKYASRKDEAMCVITGITSDVIDDIITKNGFGDYVEIASENNEICIILAGSRNELCKVMEIATQEGALKTIEINVPYAFHSKYALIGISRYIDFVLKLQVFDCQVPVISSFDQKVIQKSSDLKEELIRNMASRMYWKTSIEKVVGEGITNFVDVSLENGLTKFSKLICTDCEFLTYNKFLKIKEQEA